MRSGIFEVQIIPSPGRRNFAGPVSLTIGRIRSKLRNRVRQIAAVKLTFSQWRNFLAALRV
jgi:hypothetical protein